MKGLHRLICSVLVLLLVQYATVASYCKDITVNWTTVVLEANTVCKNTRVNQFDSGFSVKNLATTGMAVASNFAPAAPFVKSVLSIFGLVGSGEPAWRAALDEAFEDLVKCMDSKISAYRKNSIEDDWRAFMEMYRRSIYKINLGGSKEEARDEVDSLFEGMMKKIQVDFASLPTEAGYLEAEALLPVLKVITEVFWLTLTTHLGLTKQLIESGSGSLTSVDYNIDLEFGQKDLKRLANWARRAMLVIYKMYTPDITYAVTFFHTGNWKIKWQNGVNERKGMCSTGYTKANWRDMRCEQCFIDRIRGTYDDFMNDFYGRYVVPIVDLSINAYLIPRYGATQYYQMTSEGEWIDCPTISIEESNNILDIKSKCDANSECIGFNWYNGGDDPQADQALLKLGSECMETNTGSGQDYRSIWKSTSKFCYQRVMTNAYPNCEPGATGVSCTAGNEAHFENTCDNDANCIGFSWRENPESGCFKTRQCISFGNTTDDNYNYHSKCSLLNIEYSSAEALPFYYIPPESGYHYRIHIMISVVVFAFIFVTVCLCFIAKKIYEMKNYSKLF